MIRRKDISKERLGAIVDNLCEWAAEHDDEFVEAFLQASGMTEEEAYAFDLTDSISENLDEWFYELLRENNEG